MTESTQSDHHSKQKSLKSVVNSSYSTEQLISSFANCHFPVKKRFITWLSTNLQSFAGVQVTEEYMEENDVSEWPVLQNKNSDYFTEISKLSTILKIVLPVVISTC